MSSAAISFPVQEQTRSVPRRIGLARRLVDFHEFQEDHECALLAAMGFSTKYIQSQTKLSNCQITYRIRKAGLTRDNGASRLDFRNGTSPFAQTFLGIARQKVDRDLIKYLKKHS